MIFEEREHPRNYNTGIREMIEDEDIDEDIEEINWEDIEITVEQSDHGSDSDPDKNSDNENNHDDDEMELDDDSNQVLRGHTGSVFCCAFHPNDNYAITGGEDEKAILWKLSTGQPVTVLSHYHDSVCEVGFSFDGEYVAIADMMGNIEAYKINEDFSLTKIWSERIEEVQWMQWHKQAHVLLAGGLGTNVYMWKIPAGDFKVLSGEGSSPLGTFMADGKRALIAYRNGSVRVFNLVNCESLCSFKQKDWNIEEIISMTTHPNNNLSVVGDVSGNIALFTTQHPAKIVKEYRFTDANNGTSNQTSEICCIENLMFSQDNEVSSLLVCTSRGLYVWDYIKQSIKRYIICTSGVTKIIPIGSSDLFAVGTTGGTLQLVNIKQGVIERSLSGHSDTILSIAITRDLKSIMTTSDDTTIRLFQLSERMETT